MGSLLWLTMLRLLIGALPPGFRSVIEHLPWTESGVAEFVPEPVHPDNSLIDSSLGSVLQELRAMSNQ